MFGPTVLLSMLPLTTLCAVTFESQPFLLLGVLALAISFLLVLATLALVLALATFALDLARHCIHAHWCWSTLTVPTSSLLPETPRWLRERTFTYFVKI